MAEIFKDIPGYKGLYQASNLGRIKSLSIFYHSGVENRAIKERPERIVSSSYNWGGYERVCLANGKKRKSFLVHRLIAFTFLKKPVGLDFINHKNGNKKDNRLENLEWCNRSQNIRHAIEIGLKPPITGADNKISKKIYQVDENGKVLREFPSCKIASKTIGICSASLFHVLKGHWKQVNGLHFIYANTH